MGLVVESGSGMEVADGEAEPLAARFDTISREYVGYGPLEFGGKSRWTVASKLAKMGSSTLSSQSRLEDVLPLSIVVVSSELMGGRWRGRDGPGVGEMGEVRGEVRGDVAARAARRAATCLPRYVDWLLTQLRSIYRLVGGRSRILVCQTTKKKFLTLELADAAFQRVDFRFRAGIAGVVAGLGVGIAALKSLPGSSLCRFALGIGAGVLLVGILRRGRGASHVGAESGDGECGRDAQVYHSSLAVVERVECNPQARQGRRGISKMLEVAGGFEAASATCTSVGLGNPVREWTKEEKRSTKLNCGDRRIGDSGDHALNHSKYAVPSSSSSKWSSALAVAPMSHQQQKFAISLAIRQQTTSLTSGLLEKLKRREKRKAGEQGSSRAPKSARLRSEMSTAAQQLSPEPEVGEDPDQGLDFDAGEPAPVSVIETSGGRRLVH
ncbi:hypothetical protein B0H14DRAFT_3166399 [Mycena olivaceomarginata]|nr:hypothetical protein B0H14DRAFT_3166399 [Mycena olivaceomarginata]